MRASTIIPGDQRDWHEGTGQNRQGLGGREVCAGKGWLGAPSRRGGKSASGKSAQENGNPIPPCWRCCEHNMSVSIKGCRFQVKLNHSPHVKTQPCLFKISILLF